MQMNKNYVRGAAFERELVNKYKALDAVAFRSAGSHSQVDVTVIPKTGPVIFIQAKTTSDEATAKRMIKNFKEKPFLPRGPYLQVFAVKLKNKGIMMGEVYPRVAP